MVKLVTSQRESRWNDYTSAVARLRGEPPVSQLKSLRQLHDLTMAEITNLSGVSKQALIRSEQGTYELLPERLLEFWMDKSDTPYLELVNNYEEFQLKTREYYSRPFVIPDSYPEGTHPFAHLLDNCWTNPETNAPVGRMNPTEFSKLLCASQALVNRFLSKPHLQQSVPTPFIKVMRGAGYSIGELRKLGEAYHDFRTLTLDAPVTSRPAKVVAKQAPKNKEGSDFRKAILDELAGL